MNLFDFEEFPDAPDTWSTKYWMQVPVSIRKDVEQHVLACLPPELIAKLRELHIAGRSADCDPAFFHFGNGLVVRNICRGRLSDDALAAYGFGCNWDECYAGVLNNIAADLMIGS